MDSLGAFGTELTTLNMQHKITTTDILHDEVDSGLSLETSMQIEQEWMSLPVRNQENSLLRACTLNLVIFNNELLLQDLDSIKLPGSLGFCQHDLTEVTLSKNSEEIEVVETNASTSTTFAC